MTSEPAATSAQPEVPGWIQEVMARADEPLVPELYAHLVSMPVWGPGMQALKHPLVYQVPFFPAQAFRANDQLAAKRKALDEAIREHDWHSFVFLHERPYRPGALDVIESSLDDSAYWELVGNVYADTENFWQERKLWDRLLTDDRPGRLAFMDEDEQAAFADLPDELVIYRGFNGRARKMSWAWTLDRERAGWFAHRLDGPGGKPPTVLTATCRKADAVGYLTRRGEDEIVIDPRLVTVNRTEKGVTYDILHSEAASRPHQDLPADS